jgi:signal transduction histidine kinase
MTQSLKLINAKPTCPLFALEGGLDTGSLRGSDREHRPAVPADRDQILAIVSHELRNSLAAISYWSAALLQDPPAALATRNAANILASTRRMNGIIRDLLDVGRLQRGGALEIRRTVGDANEICRRMVAELEAAHPRCKLRLRLLGEGTGSWDTARLEQVVSNLVSNAVQYGADGTPVTIEGRADGNHWQLSVSNLGAPIPPALLPRLFDAFARGPDAAKQAGGNHLGIGLFIVQQAVLAHGGTIEVTSNAHQGTRFVVRLPRAVSR